MNLLIVIKKTFRFLILLCEFYEGIVSHVNPQNIHINLNIVYEGLLIYIIYTDFVACSSF